jgi:hypothetical protein
MTSGRTLLERGDTPAGLALWWVHAATLLFALALFGLPRLVAALAVRRAPLARR